MKYREVVARLKRFGVVEYTARGKGSERLLVRENEPGSGKGPQYALKCHGEGKEVAKGTLRAMLRRLGIDPREFLGES